MRRATRQFRWKILQISILWQINCMVRPTLQIASNCMRRATRQFRWKILQISILWQINCMVRPTLQITSNCIRHTTRQFRWKILQISILWQINCMVRPTLQITSNCIRRATRQFRWKILQISILWQINCMVRPTLQITSNCSAGNNFSLFTGHMSFQIFILVGHLTNWTGHNLLTDNTLKKIAQDVLVRCSVIVSDHNVKLAGHSQILVGQCPMTDFYFQHWNCIRRATRQFRWKIPQISILWQINCMVRPTLQITSNCMRRATRQFRWKILQISILQYDKWTAWLDLHVL